MPKRHEEEGARVQFSNEKKILKKKTAVLVFGSFDENANMPRSDLLPRKAVVTKEVKYL